MARRPAANLVINNLNLLELFLADKRVGFSKKNILREVISCNAKSPQKVRIFESRLRG
jgi:hypothetical protein